MKSEWRRRFVILFWVSLLVSFVNGRPQISGEDFYGEEFHDDMISEDYDDYYDLEEMEDIPTTIAPDGRRLPWYFTSPDGQGGEEEGEEEYIGGVDYEEEYNDIDYAEEDRLREEERMRRYQEEEERRRQEEEAAIQEEEERRRRQREEEERRKNLEDQEKQRREEEEERGRRLEEEERRRKIIEDQKRREELAEDRQNKMKEKEDSSEEAKLDEGGDITSTREPSGFHPDDPYAPQNGGNKLVYLGHRREDNRCPYGWVMDIYGYCRSIFKEEDRDWDWWANIRRHIMNQQGHYYGQ